MVSKKVSGAWVEIKYQSKTRYVNYLQQFFPSTNKGSQLLDEFTADFLTKQNDIYILDVKII